jgi:hypothetical protein
LASLLAWSAPIRSNGLLHDGEILVARCEAAGHARIIGSEILLGLAVE